MPSKRCPNGSRKNVNGICVKKSSTRKRCPRGYRKNKLRDCVKYYKSVKVVPNSNFAKRFFTNKKGKIHLLDKMGNRKTVIVQVNYNDATHFMDYRNLSSNPRLDCILQSISSSGKIDGDKNEILMFIKQSFALSNDEEVKYNYLDLREEIVKLNDDKIKINDKFVNFFNNRLKNGYVTTIIVEMSMRVGVSSGHSIVVYKYNNQIYFFNPKGKSELYTSRVFNSTNIYELFNQSTRIVGVGYYSVSNLKSPKQLVDTSCKTK